MSAMGINLSGKYLSLPEDAQRTQEALIRALDFDSKSQKCFAVGNMVKFTALSILNCPLYLADACVGGLLIMRPIERFRQQGASFCKSILFFFCGIYLLAGIIFHGDVYAQSQEEHQAALEAQRQAALEAQRKAEAISQFQGEFKAELQTNLEVQLQKQFQERLQEHISFLFQAPSDQEWFKGQLQEWLQDLHPELLAIMDLTYWSHPDPEMSLQLYWDQDFFNVFPKENRYNMRNCLVHLLRRRFLTFMRDSSQDLCKDMFQGLPEDLRDSQIKWDHLSPTVTLNAYLFQDLLLDFLPSLLQDRQDELQALANTPHQLNLLCKNLCRNLLHRLRDKLYTDTREIWYDFRCKTTRLNMNIAETRHDRIINDTLRGFLLSKRNPPQCSLFKDRGEYHPQLPSLIKDYFTTQIESKIQAQFQSWFASRLLGRIQTLLPELSSDRKEWLQKWLQSWMQASVSKLSKILEDDDMSLHFFQELTPQEKSRFQEFLYHRQRERLHVLLCGSRVQDLCQVTLVDHPPTLNQYIWLHKMMKDKREQISQQTPYSHCADVVLGSTVLRECALQDMVWDLVPQLLKSRTGHIQALDSNTPQDQLQGLEEELRKDLIDEFRKRMLEDLGHASELPDLNTQFRSLLKEAFLYSRNNPTPSAPPPDSSDLSPPL